jgi:hypothetical protein
MPDSISFIQAVVTKSYFTPQAKEFGERVGLELINLDRFQDLLAQYGMGPSQ